MYIFCFIVSYMNLLTMNLFSTLTQVSSLMAYFYLQNTKNLLVYNIWCLTNAVLLIAKGMMFKDYACCISEIFWIALSVYGITKHLLLLKKKKNI